jgi:hypothetical protein
MSELVDYLVKELGVTAAQARGGAGLLFKHAGEKLAKAELLKVAAAVPDLESLANDAPVARRDSQGELGKLYSLIGHEAAGWSSVVSGFARLEMDSRMASRFAGSVVSFVRGKAGTGTADILEKALK